MQDFANGYLFAQLLQAHSLQPDLHAFQNKGKPDAYLNNYKRLQVGAGPLQPQTSLIDSLSVPVFRTPACAAHTHWLLVANS